MEKKKFYKSKKFWGIAIIVAFVVSGISVALDDPEAEEESQEVSEEEQEAVEEEAEESEEEPEEVDPMENLEEEELIEYIVIDQLGETTNEDYDRIIEIETVESDDMQIANLTLAGDSNLTSNMMQRGMIMNSEDLFKVVFEEGDYDEINIEWELMLVDGHGNESFGRVMLQSLSREDLEKINWDNITTDQLESLSLMWKHPNIFD